VCVSPDDSLVASISIDSTLRIWSLGSRRQLGIVRFMEWFGFLLNILYFKIVLSVGRCWGAVWIDQRTIRDVIDLDEVTLELKMLLHESNDDTSGSPSLLF